MEKKPIIQVDNLKFTYPDGQEALKGVSFTIYEGESIALLGPNGAGKSTLLLHLNGILKGEGEIKVAGISLKNGDLYEVRRKIGFVFQDPDDQLFMPTVYEDIAFGPLSFGVSPEEVEKRVKKALNEVGLPGFEKRAPHHLSLGEKKRVSLATVLSLEPEILVLDEPTSNLDPKSRRELIQLLKSFAHTKIIATHDILFAYEVTEKTLLLYQGKLVAYGPSKEILSNDKMLEQYGLESISAYLEISEKTFK